MQHKMAPRLDVLDLTTVVSMAGIMTITAQSVARSQVHPKWECRLGFAITHNRVQRTHTLSLSYPGYIDALLRRLRSNGVKPAASPAIYHPPVYGSLAPQHATTDSSSLATTVQTKELEIAIGYLLVNA